MCSLKKKPRQQRQLLGPARNRRQVESVCVWVKRMQRENGQVCQMCWVHRAAHTTEPLDDDKWMD